MKAQTIFKLAIVIILGAFILGAERAFAVECQNIGLSKADQALFCMYTTTAQMSLELSVSIVCEDGPDYLICEQTKKAVFIQGVNQLYKAVLLADKKAHRGLFKKIFRKVW